MLAVCDFDINFTFVLPGWEGSTNNAAIYNDAVANHGFTAPPGQYYLSDAGYASTDLYMIPYQSVRYHLKEQAQAACQPEDKFELFNLRHTMARNIIEHVFGAIKSKFKILNAPLAFLVSVQVDIIFAITALWNFIQYYKGQLVPEIPWEKSDSDTDSALENSTNRHKKTLSTATQRINERRDTIAEEIWQQYQRVLGR